MEIKGFDTAANSVSKVLKSLQDSVKQEIDRIANKGFNEIVSNTPVKTGYLKSRWRIDFPAEGFTMSNDADYCAFVEFGTGRMEGRNFITPVYEVMRSEIETMIRKFSSK